MTIQAIYNHFKNPPNLQRHMLMVGALAKIITQNWVGQKIDNSAIIQACLLHDIAKPVSFDLKKQARFGLSKVEIKQLAEFQDYLKTNFGKTEHQIAIKICQEVGCLPMTVSLVDDLEWEHLAQFLTENKIQSMIPIYCDMRIAPSGILSLKDRSEELKNRDHNSNELDQQAQAGLKAEEVIQKEVDIDLSKITDEQLENEITDLKSLRIG